MGSSATAAPFDLEISFSDLCFFAPQPKDGAEDGAMYVLLPSARGMMVHYPRLFYDKAHATQGSTGPTGKYTEVDLHHTGLDLRHVKGSNGFENRLADGDIVDLCQKDITGCAVKKSALHDPPGPEVNAWVKLASGSMAPRRHTDGPWRFEGTTIAQPMPVQVVWTISDVPGDRLEILRTVWGGVGIDDPIELYPMHASGQKPKIALCVKNAIQNELYPLDPCTVHSGTQPAWHEAAKHFPAFYDLIDLQPGSRHPNLIYEGRPTSSGVHPESTNYTCMVSGGGG